MNYEEELRIVSDKVMEDYDGILADFNRKVEDYVALGMKEEQAKKVALKQIKGSFQAAMRSKAVPFEGFIVGVSQKRNKNSFAYRDAMKVLDDLKNKYPSAWLAKGVEEGKCNAQGEPTYGKHNTSDAQAWMLKQVIHEFDWEKIGYGFFRPVQKDESGKQIQLPLKYGEIRIKQPDKHMVTPGMSYKFRASCKDTTLDTLNINIAAVTKFERTGPAEYEMMRTFLDAKCEPKPFIDIYTPDEDLKIKMPEGVHFYTTEVTVVSVRIADNIAVDFVEFQSMHDDDVDENISMSIPKIINTTFDNSIGLLVYRPYMKKGNVEKGYEPSQSGEILGYLPNPLFGTSAVEVNSLGEDDFE